MSDDLQAGATDGSDQESGWRQPLDELERSLRDATRAIALLRRGLEAGGSGSRSAQTPSPDTRTPAIAAETAASAGESAAHAAFERVWERLQHERMEQQGEGAPDPPSPPRGLHLLPRQYLITVEDREATVDLVPLHRALLSLSGVEDLSLVSFANDIPVVSLRVPGELDLERLREAVSTAMDRHCEVIPQDAGRLYLRLTSGEDQGG